jgi:hypothetical protein
VGGYFSQVVPRKALIALLVSSALAPAACGGDDAASTGPGRLSAEERAIVGQSQLAIRSYCRLIALYFPRWGPRPTMADTQAANDAVDRLIALARTDPEAQYREGETMRQVLGDTAEDLEGTNCSSGLVARLDRGLASLPQP